MIVGRKMNVLGKIVIPRLLLSISYIISEIEEKAREDFYRMKKIVQLKRKRRAKMEVAIMETEKKEEKEDLEKEEEDLEKEKEDLEKEEEKPEEELETEVIRDADGCCYEIRRKKYIKDCQECVICGAPRRRAPVIRIAPEPKHDIQLRERDDKDLQAKPPKAHFKRDFDIECDDLCTKCQLKYLTEPGSPSRKPSLASPPCSPPTSPLQQGEEEEEDEDSEGIFETEIEIITRVIRKVHPDGSVTEDKKVIKIKRRTKKPLSQYSDTDYRCGRKRCPRRSSTSSTSHDSGLYDDSKQIQYVVPDEMTPFRKLYSHSQIPSSNSTTCSPVARYCVSIPNIICSNELDNNKDIADEFKTLSEKFEKVLDQHKSTRSGNIRLSIEHITSLNESDTLLLSFLSEDTHFNFKSTSHYSLYKDVMVIPDLKYKSCTDISNSGVSSKNE